MKIDSLHDAPIEPLRFTVTCTQVHSNVVAGFYCFLCLGSDNRKGLPTQWAQGLRALGKIVNKEGGPKYGDKWRVKVEVKVVFSESINKEAFLVKAPTAYAAFSKMPVIGLSSYSNQTIQQIKTTEPAQDIQALLYSIEAAHPGCKAQIELNYPELITLFDYMPPELEGGSFYAENGTSIITETKREKIEGLDKPESTGWDEYPLDSVFVRKEQRAVVEVVKRINADRFILNPDFQRDFIWSIKKQSKLIESCLMRLPLPVFYVAEGKDGRIIVVDGLQRLYTFKRYLNNDFSLNKLGEGPEYVSQGIQLVGKRFSDLPLNLQERIEDTQLTLYILDAKAPERAKLDIFDRVNSGEPLARQQMRNCLFNGPATRWLRKAADSQGFLDATGRSLNKKSMRDREVVNRFCAFRLLGVKQYRSDMDDFLARVLEKMNNMSEQELDELFEAFLNSMNINYLLFDKHAFRKSLEVKSKWAARTVINIALFDVCSVLFAPLEKNFVNEKEDQLIDRISGLLNHAEFFNAITYGTNGLLQVKTRFKMMDEVISEVV
ncbi:MAG: DUF262 domain-containing protein [Deltaproteobacteria bacterium]|nr:DUF262 domain-containing protein [Deltaproteobacteria bacterium]